MSLAEKLKQTSPPQFGLPCGVAKTLEAMNDEDREVLQAALDARGRVSHRQLHEILLSEGYEVSFSSVSLHRRKQCRCFTGRSSSTQTILGKAV